MKSIFTSAVAATLLAAVAVPGAVCAQTPSAPTGRVAVRVAVVDSYAYGNAQAVILRRGGKGSNDVIVLPSASATPAGLVTAAQTLQVIMDRDGDATMHNALFRIADAGAVPAREATAAAKILDAAHNAAPTNVAGIGMVHSAIMYLPSDATRTKRKRDGKLTIQHQP